MNDKREFLRHITATIAYRGSKTIRHAPEGFADLAKGVRNPLYVLAHINDLFDWALNLSQGNPAWQSSAPESWDREVQRFHEVLARFDAFLASDSALQVSEERLFQGPIADALTHVGQIAMMRRLAGAPIRGENYFVADIEIGRTGAEQNPAKREFD